MKLLYISHERKMGGANLCLLELVKEMQKKGHDIVVVVLYRGCPIDLELKKSGIKVFYCFFGWWQQPKTWNFVFKFCFRILHILQYFSVLRMAKYVTKRQIDIIHSNSSCIDIGMQLAAKTGIKHVWHFREFGKEDYNLEYIFGRERSMEYINQSVDAVVFISSALRKAYMGIDQNRTHIIYDGVDDNYILEYKPKHVNNRGFTFLIAGNLNSNKNQMLVLQAITLLEARGYKNINLVIAGDCTALQSSKEYKDKMCEYIYNNKLNNVKMMGFVKDMNTIRSKTDAEIVASVSEAFGRVTVEGMLGRNVVIASKAGANEELLEDKVTGLLFKSNDKYDLANKMEMLMNDCELTLRLRENGFLNAKRKFTIKQNVDRIEQLYTNLLE